MRGIELLEAAKAGDRSRVRALIEEDPALAGWCADSGESPMIAALYRGHAALAEELADASTRIRPLDVFAAAALGRQDALEDAIQAESVVDAYAFDGWTPLHLAAFFGRSPVAAALLSAGADVNAVSRNALTNTPLHAAIAGGHGEVAQMLIDRGANVHAVDAGGHTPLHIAAESGLVGVVEALLARGADPHAVDSENKTPLSRAAARKHTAIVDLINVDS